MDVVGPLTGYLPWVALALVVILLVGGVVFFVTTFG
jgi:hypothetical protein